MGIPIDLFYIHSSSPISLVLLRNGGHIYRSRTLRYRRDHTLVLPVLHTSDMLLHTHLFLLIPARDSLLKPSLNPFP